MINSFKERILLLREIFRSAAKKAGITRCPFSKLTKMTEAELAQTLVVGTEVDKSTIRGNIGFHSAGGYQLWLSELEQLVDSGFLFRTPCGEGADEQTKLLHFIDDVQEFFDFSAWSFLSKALGKVSETASASDLWGEFKVVDRKQSDYRPVYQLGQGFEPPLKMVLTALVSLRKQKPDITEQEALVALSDLKLDWLTYACNASNATTFPMFGGDQYEPLGYNLDAFVLQDGKYGLDPRCFECWQEGRDRKIQTGCAPFYAKAKYKGKSTNVGLAFLDILNRLAVEFMFEK